MRFARLLKERSDDTFYLCERSPTADRLCRRRLAQRVQYLAVSRGGGMLNNSWIKSATPEQAMLLSLILTLAI